MNEISSLSQKIKEIIDVITTKVNSLAGQERSQSFSLLHPQENTNEDKKRIIETSKFLSSEREEILKRLLRRHPESDIKNLWKDKTPVKSQETLKAEALFRSQPEEKKEPARISTSRSFLPRRPIISDEQLARELQAQFDAESRPSRSRRELSEEEELALALQQIADLEAKERPSPESPTLPGNSEIKANSENKTSATTGGNPIVVGDTRKYLESINDDIQDLVFSIARHLSRLKGWSSEEPNLTKKEDLQKTLRLLIRADSQNCYLIDYWTDLLLLKSMRNEIIMDLFILNQQLDYYSQETQRFHNTLQKSSRSEPTEKNLLIEFQINENLKTIARLRQIWDDKRQMADVIESLLGKYRNMWKRRKCSLQKI